MSLAIRNAIFVTGLVVMVCMLNLGIYILDGADFSFEKHNSGAMPMVFATLIAGPLAIGIGSYKIVTGNYPLNKGKLEAAKSGLFSVLLSYLLLGLLMIPILPLVSFAIGESRENISSFFSVFVGFGAMIVAFMVSAWIAIPIAITLAILLCLSSEQKTYKSPISFYRMGVFVALIFIAAIWVSYEAIPSGDKSPGIYLNEWTLACGVVSAFSAALCWYFYMDTEESKTQGALAGLTSAFLAVFLIGPVIAISSTFQQSGFSFNELLKSSMIAAIFSFFAVIFAAWKAVPISIIIGFLVARSAPYEQPHAKSE